LPYILITGFHGEVLPAFKQKHQSTQRLVSGVSKRPYRFDYTTDDSSFLRLTFIGSVLNNEPLWIQPICLGCVSGVLVREVSCQQQS
jgi:hypothetical protein